LLVVVCPWRVLGRVLGILLLLALRVLQRFERGAGTGLVSPEEQPVDPFHAAGQGFLVRLDS